MLPVANNYSKTMRILILIIMCLLVNIAAAKVFKHVDKDGNITYTDVPTSTTDKTVQQTPMTTYKPVPAPTTDTGTDKDNKQEPKAVTNYDALNITSPADKAVIRANSGTITVEIQSLPGLNTDAGHQFVILIDGQAQQTSQANSITVNNLDRGTHSLSAQILDKDNNVLVSSTPVQINILRASIQNPNHPAARRP